MSQRQRESVPAQLLVPVEVIERRIFLIRGQKVMLDSDSAQLYGVPTRRPNEQVRRNLARFPSDFMFQLTSEETVALRSQIATSKKGRGGRRYLPLAFTEHSVSMLSSVLKSERAVQMNIFGVSVRDQLHHLLDGALAETRS